MLFPIPNSAPSQTCTPAPMSDSEIRSLALQSMGMEFLQPDVIMLEVSVVASILGFILYIHSKEKNISNVDASALLKASVKRTRLFVPAASSTIPVFSFLVPLALVVCVSVDKMTGFISLGRFSFLFIAFVAGFCSARTSSRRHQACDCKMPNGIYGTGYLLHSATLYISKLFA